MRSFAWIIRAAALSLQLLLVHVVQISRAAGATSTCTADVDCSLNGICLDDAGGNTKCHCDPAWTGKRCQYLNFEPASRDNGFRIEGTVTWGASILPDDRSEGGAWVAFAAKMVNGCGLNSWTTNSAVVVATSADDPAGPYIESGSTVSPPWAHNPQAIYIPPDESGGRGTYVVYALGDGVPIHGPVQNCTGMEEAVATSTSSVIRPQLRSLRQRRTKESHNVTVTFKLHYSNTGPLGPWKTHMAEIHDFPQEYDFPGNWNPAPILLSDGRVRIVVHTNYPEMWSGEVIVEADSWQGPYKPITLDITSCTKCQEDPFMFMDKRGHWHLLYHKMFDPAGDNPIPSPGWTGGHSFSVDGIHWSPIYRAYNTTVLFEDGRTAEMLRRERPKLIFASDGVTPTHLSNGVVDPDGTTHTMVVPLKTK